MTRPAPSAAARHLLDLGHRDVLVLAVERPVAHGRRADRRHRAPAPRLSMRPSPRSARISPTSASSAAPASIEGGAAGVPARLVPRAPADRGPCHERRDGDRGDAGRRASWACASPTTLSVVGFDDIDVARDVDPPLTTVRQPIAEKGSEAVRLLLAAIDRPDGEPAARSIFASSTRLVVRGSTGPATSPARHARRDTTADRTCDDPGHARHARLGPRRGLLPGLPRPIRGQRARRASPARSSRGTRRRPTRVQGRRPARASSSTSTTSPSLGANALYLTPVFQSASNHRYHTYDYLAVDPLLGGDAALRELLDRGARPGHAGRARRRVQPHRARLLAVPPRARDGRGLAVPALVPLRRGRRSTGGGRSTPIPTAHARAGVAARRAACRARPRADAGSPLAGSATRPGGACRRSRSSTSASRPFAST